MKTEQDYRDYLIMKSKMKSKGMAYLIFLLFGGIGLHRFYLEKTVTGLLVFFCNTCLFLGLWLSTDYETAGMAVVFIAMGFIAPFILIYDLFTLSGQVDRFNNKILNQKK